MSTLEASASTTPTSRGLLSTPTAWRADLLGEMFALARGAHRRRGGPRWPGWRHCNRGLRRITSRSRATPAPSSRGDCSI